MLTEQARAKLNLGLAVTARRGDGFHELDTIFALLTLADELSAVPAAEPELELTAATDLPGAATVGTADNLVMRAARAFMAATGSGGAHFSLVKRIPAGAGLGGGSADAAAALRLMARLYPEHAQAADLPALALSLGSDVPFMYSGAVAARGRGRGERLEPLHVPERHVVLANPASTVSSGEAFGWLQSFSRRLDLAAIQEALEQGSEPRWPNALMPGVSREVREVRAVISALRDLGLQGVIMSGSGPTCFGLAADGQAAQAAVRQLQEAWPDWWVHADRVGVSPAVPC